jgi:hypothetical protein
LTSGKEFLRFLRGCVPLLLAIFASLTGDFGQGRIRARYTGAPVYVVPQLTCGKRKRPTTQLYEDYFF